ncbi:MAG: alpha/beta hydrolase [Actinomycetota bacterium]
MLLLGACSSGSVGDASADPTAPLGTTPAETTAPSTIAPTTTAPTPVEPTPETSTATSTMPVSEPDVTEPDVTEPDVSEVDVGEPDVTAFVPVFSPGACGGDPFVVTEGVRCGTVAVPVDHDDPMGEQLTIAVAQVEPLGGTPLMSDPILRLQGGPGSGITDSVGGWADWEQRDLFGVVLIEYRGEPNSAPALTCPDKAGAVLAAFTTLDPFPVEADRIADAAGRCAERARADGVDLTAFDTRAIADDIELVRQALQVERWNLVGVSYGTTTAMEVMRRHPDSVRSAILDSAYPPERFTIADVAGGLDHVLDRFDAACPPGSDCNPADLTVTEQFAEMVAAFDAEPGLVVTAHPETGEPVELLLDGADVTDALWLAVWSGNVPELALDAVVGGDPIAQLFLVQVVVEEFLADYRDSSLLQADIVECRDRGHLLSRDEIDAAVAERPELGSIFRYATYVGHGITCDAIDAGQTDAGWTDSLRSDIPTLVLAGVWDAVTPPAWGEALLDGLPNGTFVTYPGLAHGTWDDTDCSFGITQAFLNDPAAELDVSCVTSMPDPLPVPPGADGS